MTDHAVRNQSIGPIEQLVVEIKTVSLPDRFGRKLLVFRPELWEVFLQQIELHRIIHGDACEFARFRPERFRQRLGVRHRLIKMCRCDVKPMLLPAPEQFRKFCALKASWNYRRYKFSKLFYIDVSPRYFIGDFAQGSWRRLDLAPRFDRVERDIGATRRIQAKFIDHGVRDPGNFDLTAFFSLGHEFLISFSG